MDHLKGKQSQLYRMHASGEYTSTDLSEMVLISRRWVM